MQSNIGNARLTYGRSWRITGDISRQRYYLAKRPAGDLECRLDVSYALAELVVECQLVSEKGSISWINLGISTIQGWE